MARPVFHDSSNQRYTGSLALSRAIGDFDFKSSPNLPPEEQIVTADPDITIQELTEDDEFLVLACDGIWDCMTNQDVVDFIRVRIATTGGNLGSICEALMDRCLASDSELGGIGCDNMTVIIVGFLRGKSIEEWAESIKHRIEIDTGKPAQEVEEEEIAQAGRNANYNGAFGGMGMQMVELSNGMPSEAQ